MASPFSPETREATLAALPATALDLLVIGGGITGGGVARGAALRGLRVALVERLDWDAGTSSRSSKLIHGGVRYLEQGDVGLVREAATERAVLRRLAPHLALPVRLVMPTYGRAAHAKLGLGLWTFERIATVAPEERHTMWSREEALAREPTLDGTRLHGAATFIEYLTCDARLVLETVLGAHAAGALCVSRVEATEIAGGEVALRDTLTGRALHARSGVVVNAAGPWVDEVRRRAGALAGVRLHLTRGIHLVVPHGRLPVRHIVVMQARDHRSVFAVPRGEVTYLGTTDTDHGPPTDHPAVPGEDADYLLDAANRTFAGPPLARADVVAAWAGLRPLLHEEGKRPSEISRKDEIMVSDTGLVSIAGGKLTTHRRMAERVVDLVVERLGRAAGACSSSIRARASSAPRQSRTWPPPGSVGTEGAPRSSSRATARWRKASGGSHERDRRRPRPRAGARPRGRRRDDARRTPRRLLDPGAPARAPGPAGRRAGVRGDATEHGRGGDRRPPGRAPRRRRRPLRRGLRRGGRRHAAGGLAGRRPDRHEPPPRAERARALRARRGRDAGRRVRGDARGARLHHGQLPAVDRPLDAGRLGGDAGRGAVLHPLRQHRGPLPRPRGGAAGRRGGAAGARGAARLGRPESPRALPRQRGDARRDHRGDAARAPAARGTRALELRLPEHGGGARYRAPRAARRLAAGRAARLRPGRDRAAVLGLGAGRRVPAPRRLRGSRRARPGRERRVRARGRDGQRHGRRDGAGGALARGAEQGAELGLLPRPRDAGRHDRGGGRVGPDRSPLRDGRRGAGRAR